MWLILSLFLRKRRQLDGILHLLNTMSVLLCLAECACIVERTSNVAYSVTVSEKKAPVGWNFALVEHNVRPIVLGRVRLYCGENIKCGLFCHCF